VLRHHSITAFGRPAFTHILGSQCSDAQAARGWHDSIACKLRDREAMGSSRCFRSRCAADDDPAVTVDTACETSSIVAQRGEGCVGYPALQNCGVEEGWSCVLWPQYSVTVFLVEEDMPERTMLGVDT
jgi:hypothetical protein